MTTNPVLEIGEPTFCGRVGVARRDITPPGGIYARNWGCAPHETAEGIHRPLWATVLSLGRHDGGPPLVLASLDLGWWASPNDSWPLRNRVLGELGLDSSRLMIHLTHTHSGPSLSPRHAQRPGGALIEPYLKKLGQSLGEAAREAVAQARPAVISWASGRCGLAGHRNLPQYDGARVLCGFNPARPADDTVLVGRVTDSQGCLLATLVNYACHPTTLGGGNRLISPDYVGALRQTVEQATGGAPCIFLQGASGDLGPRRSYEALPEFADRNGRQLGHAVLSNLEGMLPPGKRLRFAGVEESGAPLAIWQEVTRGPSQYLAALQGDVDLPLKDLPSAEQISAQIRDCRDPVLAERLRRRLVMRQGLGEGPSVRLPYWVWMLGEAVLVGVAAEAHSDLQRELRRRFPQLAVAVLNIVNDYYSYLPPATDYPANSYQVQVALFQPGSLEKVIETCSRTVERAIQESRL
jgi:hypothetical protein